MTKFTFTITEIDAVSAALELLTAHPEYGGYTIPELKELLGKFYTIVEIIDELGDGRITFEAVEETKE